jgi:ATP-dependent RNA helicase RhlE
MLDMGFVDDLNKIFTYLPKQRQTMMFSATMPPKIRQLAGTILITRTKLTLHIKTGRRVKQLAYLTHDRQKNRLISHILTDKDLESVIVFSSTKHKVKSLVNDLKRDGFLCNGHPFGP